MANTLQLGLGKVGERSREQPEGFFFNIFTSKMKERALLLPWISPLYTWYVPYNTDI